MVENFDGNVIESQIIPTWSWHKGERGILTPRVSAAKYRLLFRAQVPPLGLATYIIRSTNSSSQNLYVFAMQLEQLRQLF